MALSGKVAPLDLAYGVSPSLLVGRN